MNQDLKSFWIANKSYFKVGIWCLGIGYIFGTMRTLDLVTK